MTISHHHCLITVQCMSQPPNAHIYSMHPSQLAELMVTVQHQNQLQIYSTGGEVSKTSHLAIWRIGLGVQILDIKEKWVWGTVQVSWIASNAYSRLIGKYCQAQLSPSCQPQPSWLSFSLILHSPHFPIDSKMQLGKASSSSHSWLSKQPQLVGSQSQLLASRHPTKATLNLYFIHQTIPLCQ